MTVVVIDDIQVIAQSFSLPVIVAAQEKIVCERLLSPVKTQRSITLEAQRNVQLIPERLGKERMKILELGAAGYAGE